uniref:Sugar phosphate transporter domain-containing protein n=1 Tax=Calcidiscus leptoporus TaxID=127549 RepID=A0A7S0JD55_9EUKA
MPELQDVESAWYTTLPLLACIVSWYATSISLTLFNKWLFTIYGLSFPLLITTLHMAIKIPVAYASMRCYRLPPAAFNGIRGMVCHVMPLGVTTAGDIAFSNMSLLYITVTYYTIFKSSVPLWILLFSTCLGLQRCRIELLLVVLCIAAGIALASVNDDAADEELADAAMAEAEQAHIEMGEVERPHGGRRAGRRVGDGHLQLLGRLLVEGEDIHDATSMLTGGLLVLSACACAGFRWACTQLLLSPQAVDHGQLEAHAHLPLRAMVAHERRLCSDSPASEAITADEADAQCLVSDGSEGGSAERHGLQKDSSALVGTHPVTLLFYFSPFGVAVLAPVALYAESGRLAAYLGARSWEQAFMVFALASAGGVLSFALLLLELRIVRLSSGLTLSIAGIFKEVLTVACSALFLHDKLTLFNMAGFVMCLAGIGVYNHMQWSQPQGATRSQGGPLPDSDARFGPLTATQE